MDVSGITQACSFHNVFHDFARESNNTAHRDEGRAWMGGG
jgi:hypothetical protein